MRNSCLLSVCVLLGFAIFSQPCTALPPPVTPPAANIATQDLVMGPAIEVKELGQYGTLVTPPCHSYAFSQIPGYPEYFIGKWVLKGSSGGCDISNGGTATLALFIFDWSTHTMLMIRYLPMPIPYVRSDGKTVYITQAYDPYTVRLDDGELWVSFECGGVGIAGTSACVAPLLVNGLIDEASPSYSLHSRDS